MYSLIPFYPAPILKSSIASQLPRVFDLLGSGVDQKPLTMGSGVDWRPFAMGSDVDWRPLAMGSRVDHGPLAMGSGVDRRPLTMGSKVNRKLLACKDGVFPFFLIRWTQQVLEYINLVQKVIILENHYLIQTKTCQWNVKDLGNTIWQPLTLNYHEHILINIINSHHNKIIPKILYVDFLNVYLHDL